MRTVAEVAAEHADLVRALPEGGVAVLNADDEYVDVWRDAARAANAAICEFGVARRADVTARLSLRGDGSDLQLRTPAGDAAVTLAVPGRHMAANALAATAAALARMFRCRPLCAASRSSGHCPDGSRRSPARTACM